MLRFSGSGVSDVGRVRARNEDSAFVAPYVAVVADGVGGAAAGDVASATAAFAAASVALGRRGESGETVVSEAYAAAMAGVRLGVRQDHARRLGMATTLTMMVCDGARVVLGHVGDSRAYLLSAGALTRLSTDHTYVQHLVDTGGLTEQARAAHPWRNVVLRSVDGDPGGGWIDVVPLAVAPGDRLLLCSDGLTDLVDEEGIAVLLAQGDPDDAATRLTVAALDAGGRDNVTCVVLDLVDGPPVVGDGKLLGAVADPWNVVDPAAVPRPRAQSA